MLVKTFFIALLLSACQSKVMQDDLPAIITNPSKDVKHEINQVISQLLNGIQVTIADDVFTQQDKINLVRKEHKNIENNPLVGNDLNRPEKIIFQLIINSQGCFIVRQNTQQRKQLFKAECRAISETDDKQELILN